MLPASNVSVPLTVVMTTRSSVPDSVKVPPVVQNLPPELSPPQPLAVHIFPETFVNTIVPCLMYAAFPSATIENPVVGWVTVEIPPFAPLPAAVAYPDVVTEPAPICTCITLVPLVLTPLNITVIRFTHEGIPVNVMLVPDVDATAVANVLTDIVAVAACKVIVLVPATAGAASVTCPDVSPDMTSELMFNP